VIDCATGAFKNRREWLVEKRGQAKPSTKTAQYWKEDERQDSADRMGARTKANEIACGSRKNNGKHKERSKDLRLPHKRVSVMTVQKAAFNRSPSQAVRNHQAHNASQKKKLEGVRRDNGSQEFHNAFQYVSLKTRWIMP